MEPKSSALKEGAMIRNEDFDRLLNSGGQDFQFFNVEDQEAGTVFLITCSWKRTYLFEIADPCRRLVNIFPFKKEGEELRLIEDLRDGYEITETVSLGMSVSFGNWYTGFISTIKKLNLQ